MGLPWFRMDSNVASHPKVAELMKVHKADGAKAYALWTFAIGYGNAHGTDGKVTAVTLPWMHGTPKLADLLVTVGLFDKLDDGWRVHNFDQFQMTAKSAAIKSAANVSAGAKGGCRTHHGPDCWSDATGCSHAPYPAT